MSKKTHWKHVADNSLHSFEDPAISEARKKKMFKWGLLIDRMPYNKPRLNHFLKKLDISDEE